MNAVNSKKHFSNLKFEVILLEEGIIENIVKEAAHIEKEDVQKLKELNTQFAGGKKYCVLVTSLFLSTISKEARELSASREFAETTIAKALVVNSTGHQIVGNFYLAVNKPHIKTKIFHDREKALAWLKVQLKQG